MRVATYLFLALMSAVLKMKPMFHFLSHNQDNLTGPSMSPQTTRLLYSRDIMSVKSQINFILQIHVSSKDFYDRMT